MKQISLADNFFRHKNVVLYSEKVFKASLTRILGVKDNNSKFFEIKIS